MDLMGIVATSLAVSVLVVYLSGSHFCPYRGEYSTSFIVIQRRLFNKTEFINSELYELGSLLVLN